MLPELGRYVGGRVLGAVLFVLAVAVLIWFWQMPAEQKAHLASVVGRAVVWVVFALVLPWALFFVPPLVVRADSNAVSAVVMLGYLLMDAVAALWLAGGWPASRVGGGVMIVGLLSAGVYNVVVSEYLARRSEEV